MNDLLSKTTKLDGLVLYADGSCKHGKIHKSNPGYLGFGFHGYAYTDNPPKKGSGNHKFTLTKSGYIDNAIPNSSPVTPYCYFDSYGCTSHMASNNTAEILAAQAALQQAVQWPVNKVLLKTDSNYVVKGINEWSQHWVKNRWIRKDGTPVPNKNEWQSLLDSVSKLHEAGAKLEVKWVEGHSTHIGNNLADKLADIGSEMSIAGKDLVHTNIAKSEGYWKAQEERHALLAYRSMYFSTLGSSFTPGEYYLGQASKSDEIIGVRDADGSYAVVQLNEPDLVLEMIRTRQASLSGDVDTMVLARIDRIYNGTKADDLMRYGEHCLSQANGRVVNLNYITDRFTEEPLTEQLTPPMLAMRTMNCIAELKEMLDTFKTGDLEEYARKQWEIVNITDHFLDTQEKKTGKAGVAQVQQLKASFNSLVLKTDIKTKVFGADVRFDMTFGIDILPRNNLKRVVDAGKPVKMHLIVVKESPEACRYHTVISSGEDWSIWSGFYTNLVLLPKT